MSAMLMKHTSLGSPYSMPSVPNPTPATEAIDPPPDLDCAAVAKILGPIQETLNESAVEAMYPSPPINTPEILSPAPSVVYRYPATRGRGFSVIGDRLAQLKIDDRKLSHRDADVTSSNRSVAPSVTEDDEYELASISEVLSDGGKDKHGAAHCSSPTVNPRIEEYLSFTSKDLPTKTPAPCIPSTLVDTGSLSTKTAIDTASSRDSLKSDGGVTEKSNWAEELEDSIDRACMRLEQLAQDEFITDPSKSVEQYYIARLKRLLGDGKRVIPVNIEKVEDTQK